MKKNQSGVSMVSLVITIIVIIILAAVAFSGSQETIGRAGFSGFTTDIDSVRTAFMSESIPTLMGEQTAKNNAVSEAQAYNFLAKGASTTLVPAASGEHAWLSRAQAAAIPATRIEKESAKQAIGIDLPVRTVNTFGATGVEMSYFVTNKGDIFVWPPYARSDDGLFYVNDTITVKVPSTVNLEDAAGTDKTLSAGTIISGDDEQYMYWDGFMFDVNGVTIIVDANNSVDGTEQTTNISNPTATKLDDGADTAKTETLRTTPAIYYLDERNAEPAEGIESKWIYQDDTKGAETTLPGVDKVEK